MSHPSLGGEQETQDGWGAAGIEWSRDFHCLGWDAQNKLSVNAVVVTINMKATGVYVPDFAG